MDKAILLALLILWPFSSATSASISDIETEILAKHDKADIAKALFTLKGKRFTVPLPDGKRKTINHLPNTDLITAQSIQWNILPPLSLERLKAEIANVELAKAESQRAAEERRERFARATPEADWRIEERRRIRENEKAVAEEKKKSLPAGRVLTRGGQPACLSKTWYEDLVKFTSAKDFKSFEAYISQKRCILLKEGLEVTMMEWPGMFGGSLSFAYNGIKFWAPREAISF